MATSRAADTYESQNDDQLDALHSKIRTLRGVTTDIYDDVERQNVTLDDTGNTFTTFAGTLAQSSRRAVHAFGGGGGGGAGAGVGVVKQYRLLVWVVGGVVGVWMVWHVMGWFWPGGASAGAGA